MQSKRLSCAVCVYAQLLVFSVDVEIVDELCCLGNMFSVMLL